MAPRRYEALKSLLKPGSRGLILIHPDPDSLASAWALVMIFRKNRASADIALAEPIKRVENRTMVRLLRIPTLPFKETMIHAYDLKCTVDAQPNQFPNLKLPGWDIVIDHHPEVPTTEMVYADIRPDMGATSSMMVEYLLDARIRINERIATALCYAIITDTDRFQRSVTKQDAQAFGRVFARANHALLALIDSKEIPRRQMEYFQVALQRFRVKNRRLVVHIGACDSADIAVILADFFVRISGIHTVIVSCIASEKLVLIFRSTGPRRNVGKSAKNHFGELGSAGGHRAAARAEIPLDRLPPEVKVYSYDSIETFVQKRLARPGKPPAGDPVKA